MIYPIERAKKPGNMLFHTVERERDRVGEWMMEIDSGRLAWTCTFTLNQIASLSKQRFSYTLHMNYMHTTHTKKHYFLFILSNACLNSIDSYGMRNGGCEFELPRKQKYAPQIPHSAHSWMINCRKYGNKKYTHDSFFRKEFQWKTNRDILMLLLFY